MDNITIPHDIIDQFRIYFDESLPKFNDFQWQCNKKILKNLYGIDKEKDYQSKRGEIIDKKIRKEIMLAIASFEIPKKILQGSYMNFARGILPIAVHVDIAEDKRDGDTIIIPLTFNKKIKTIWFNEKVFEPIFDNWISAQNFDTKEKTNNLRNELDLTNAYYHNPKLIDFLKLDGIGEWTKGNAFRGRRSQPHCSNNFKSSGIDFKDYIIIQTGDE